MWICQRCHTENHDSSTVCASCGTQRAAGRFSSPAQSRPAPAVQPPRVIVPNPMEKEEAAKTTGQACFQPAEPEIIRRKRKRSPFIWFAKAVGVILLILLPLLVILLAIIQYEALASALVPLLTQGEGHPWLGKICYGVFLLAAVLLSSLPGLWTLLLARKAEK